MTISLGLDVFWGSFGMSAHTDRVGHQKGRMKGREPEIVPIGPISGF